MTDTVIETRVTKRATGGQAVRREGRKEKAKSLFISRGACLRNDGNSPLPETRKERHTCRAIHANATYSLPNLAREVDPRAGRSQDASCLINRRERVPMQDWDGLLLDSLAAAIRAILGNLQHIERWLFPSQRIWQRYATTTPTRPRLVRTSWPHCSILLAAIPHGQLIPCSSRYEGMRATHCGNTNRLAFQTTNWGVS